MTKYTPPRIVAAHIHHSGARATSRYRLATTLTPKGRGQTPETPTGSWLASSPSPKSQAPSSAAKKPVRPATPTSSSRDFKARFVVGSSQSRKSHPKVRVPFAPIPEDVTEVEAEASITSSSPAPTFKATIYQNRVKATMTRKGVEPIKAKNERVMAHAGQLDKWIRQLEQLADEFKTKVEGIAEQFDALNEELSEHCLEFEGLETDYFDALASLEEEKDSVTWYTGLLRNAEVEISILRSKLPKDADDATMDFSQAKSMNPRYERSFSAPHLLARHQRSSCPQTTLKLQELREQAKEIERERKRRRTDKGPGDNAGGRGVPNVASESEESRPTLGTGVPSNSRGASGPAAASRVSAQRINLFAGHISCPQAIPSTSQAIPSTSQAVPSTSQAVPVPSTSQAVPSTSQAVPSTSQAVPSTSQAVPSTSQAVPVPSTSRAGSLSAPALTNPSNLAIPSNNASKKLSTTHLDSFRLKKRYEGELPVKDPDTGLTSLDVYDSLNHLDDGDDDEEESADKDKAKAKHRDRDEGEKEGEEEGEDGDKEDGEDGNKDEGEEGDKGKGKGKGKEKKLSPEAHDAKYLLAPFPNISSFELGEWFYGQGPQKSLKDFRGLIKILTSPTFSLDDIRKTKWTGVFQDLGKNKEDMSLKRSMWVDDTGWRTTEVKIDVPIHSHAAQGKGVERRAIGTLHHRSVVSILEERLRNSDLSFLHLDGHKLMWQPGGQAESQEFRVVSELYNSNAFLEAQREVRDNPPANIKDCPLPRVVIGLQFWSDATHLSTFSTSKLWPLYMAIGNDSKYRRGKGDGPDPCYHVAYFDSIPDEFKDYLTKRTGGKIPRDLMSHLNRECFHEQWVIILDDELLEAILEGVVIECSDGVTRRFFIRIFTYSSDYPERVLIATIKTRGDCPCVRCLTRAQDFTQMGTPEDMSFRRAHPRMDSAERQENVASAMKVIYSGNRAVNGDPVKRILRHSNAPTMNAFSKRLKGTGFDIFSTLVVDILHEYEIGVFKALFIHLLRVLQAAATGKVLIHRLNTRYRSIPTFNQAIRKFSSNVSELKRRAARDYEDILQCAIPAFDGLFPESLDTLTSKLLYINARWHALAKLRIHTDATIALLEEATSQLGEAFRGFKHATDSIKTLELQSEADKRAKSASKKKPSTKKPSASASSSTVPRSGFTFRIVHPLVEDSSPQTTASQSDPSNSPGDITTNGATGSASASTQALPPNVSQAVRQGPLAHPHSPSHDLPTEQTTTAPAPSQAATLSAAPPTEPTPVNNRSTSNTRQPKQLNIATIKFHALGHYPDNIRLVGPTDLYSTEWGENFHRSPKAWFKSTSKRFVRKELSMHERRRTRLKRAKYRLIMHGKSAKAEELRQQRLASRNPDIHHYIGTSKSAPIYLSQFSAPNGALSADVACSFFIRRLKKHLLPRYLRALEPQLDHSSLQEALQCFDWSQLVFKDDRIYTHKIMRIKYQTYDTRKDEDIIHLETDQCNVMLRNHVYSYGSSSSHPFVYGKVIGVLHAKVGYVGDIGRRGFDYFYFPMEFLWIRWYKVHPAGGMELDQAELLAIDQPDSHSFVDPLEVMRACHIIPKFSAGPRYQDGQGKSEVAGDGSDWEKYFINRFVDRDMFMRYEWGLGIGHTYSYKDATTANLHILRTHGSTTRLEDATATHQGQSHPEEPLADRDNDAVAGPGAELEGGPDIGNDGEGINQDGDEDEGEDEGEDEDEDEDEQEGMSDMEDYDDRRDDDDEVEKEYLLFGS